MTFFAHGVEEISFTSGAGSYTLSGATPNMLTFAAKVPDQSIVTYRATDGARSEYAYGIFDYPSTLRRLSILSSSNDDELIDWQVSGQRIITLMQDPNVIGPNTSGLPGSDPTCPFPSDGECAQVLTTLGPGCYNNEWKWLPYSIPPIWVEGEPNAGQRFRFAVTEYIRFDADFAGSYAYADTAPTSTPLVILVNRVDSSGAVTPLGTITFGGPIYLSLGETILSLGTKKLTMQR